MSNYPEAVYWLTLINHSGLKLNIIKPIIQRWCLTDQRSLSELFDLSPLEWSTTFGLSDEAARLALSTSEKLANQAAALSQWQSEGLELLTLIDPRYPKRLQATLPPAQQPLLLWARGAVNLLNESCVAMLGDEAPDEAADQFLDELMQSLVADDIGLVSGYGRGLDRATFETMLKTSGGQAVVIIPMGLSAFAKTTSRLDRAITDGQIVLVSPFGPATPYQERLAEARTLLIDHLALALLILHTSEEAKTRAESALNRGQPVFVSLTDTTSNRALIDQGALLLTDTGEVVEMVQQAVIDAALQDSNGEEQVAAQPVPSGPLLPADSDDDFSLGYEEVEPIDTEEALEILSLGGEIPDLLRRRLEENVDNEDEAE